MIMKYIEKIPYVLRSVLIFALGVILLTLFNFIDFFGNTLTNILIYILFFILLTLNCIKLAKKSKNKGLIVGIKVSSLVLGIWIIFKLILKISFNSFSFAFIILTLLTSIIGGIMGANMKKSSNV